MKLTLPCFVSVKTISEDSGHTYRKKAGDLELGEGVALLHCTPWMAVLLQ